MDKVIITGADGFVGSYTVQYFLEQGVTVLALDMGETPRRLAEHPLLTYKCCDITDIAGMLEMIPAGEYDTFIHFAWAGSAGAARVDYQLQMQNALNTVACLKAAKELGCKRFVCAGSIMEYEVEAAIHSQGSHPGMGYIYGMGKHIAHCMCKSIAVDIGIELVWPMITNAYGVGELSPRFVNTTIRKIIKGEPLQFTAARPLKEFILEMVQSLAPDQTPLFGDIPFTGTNMPLRVFDTSATEADCGFKAQVSFAEGTALTMEWLKTAE